MMAIAQNDGKKVLAFSTISNLGLIVACAGIGVEETVWGGVLLMIFHAVSKSMLFQAVGATENCLGSRDIEDMHGLLLRLPKLTYIMGIGIAGMYLAPFGMLISKWVALKAFVDSENVLLVIFIAYGSATTMFYWTKWLSKLTTQHRARQRVKEYYTQRRIFIHVYPCRGNAFDVFAVPISGHRCCQSYFGIYVWLRQHCSLHERAGNHGHHADFSSDRADDYGLCHPYGKTRTGTHLHERR